MIYSLIRSIIDTVKATPRMMLTIALAWLFLSTSCGMLGLLASLSFFNVVMLFFFAVAVILAISGLMKWSRWRKDGYQLTLSDGSVVFILEHILDVQTREKLLLNARETIVQASRQYVLAPPPATETFLHPVTCSICQQEVTLRVANAQKRQSVRLRLILFSTVSIVLVLALELLVYFITGGHPDMYPIGYAHCVCVIFLLVSTFSLTRLLNYMGVTVARIPPGHKIMSPTLADLKHVRMQTGR